jgi:protein O-GlcNAc transferase
MKLNPPPEGLLAARQLLAAGHLDAACTVLRNAISIQPSEPVLWQALGQVEFSARRFAAAREAFNQANTLLPDQIRVLLFLGIAERELGDLDASLSALKRASYIRPALPEVCAQLGATLQLRGNFEEAVNAYRDEITRFPLGVRAYNNLGDALRKLARFDEALIVLERAVALNPHFALAWRNLGDVRNVLGKKASAVTAWIKAAQENPNDSQAHENIGLERLHAHDFERAAQFLKLASDARPVEKDPGVFAATHCAYAYALAGLNQPALAREVANNVLAKNPDNIQAGIIAALTMPRVFANRNEINQYRKQYADGLVRLESDFKKVDTDVLWGIVSNNFYLAYQGEDDLAMQSRYANWLHDLIPQNEFIAPKAFGSETPIKIAFVGGHFYDCTAGKYFQSWVTELASEKHRNTLEVSVFYYGQAVDLLTDNLAKVCQFKRITSGVHSVATQIAEGQFDVLIYPEIGMDSSTYLLANLRLAPLQCAAWGHPITTGSKEIDVFFSIAAMEPPGSQAHYREQLVMLPGIGTHYKRPQLQQPLSREALGLAAPLNGLTDVRLLLCPQSLFKIHPDCDAPFVEILSTLVNQGIDSKLVLFEDLVPAITQAFKTRFSAALKVVNLNWEQHVILLPRCDHQRFLAINSVCDLMLDTFHWSGGNTALDAIAMGLPIITLPGRFMRGRQSMAMLQQLGLAELIADNVAHYVELGIKIISDNSLRANIRERLLNHEAHGKKIFADDAPLETLASFIHNHVRLQRTKH